MTPTQRLLPFLAVLLLPAACTEAVAPTRDLEITPARASISLAQAQANGIPATFTNRTSSVVTIYTTSCFGGRITMERAVPGGWVPMKPPDVVCAAASIVGPMPLDVAPGASVALTAAMYDLAGVTTGRYRMHVRSSGGDAYSGTLTIE